MQTKEKLQATHIYTQRLIEIRTDTNRHKHMQTQNMKIGINKCGWCLAGGRGC